MFLDVGQGDSLLIQNQNHQVVIDAGRGRRLVEHLGQQLPWFDRYLEVLIVTHPQQDHLEGFLHLLDSYSVGLVILPQAPASSKLQEEWLTALASHGIPHQFAVPGQVLTANAVIITVLGPLNTPRVARAAARDINNASVITRVEMCPHRQCLSLLLTGDADKTVEDQLVRHIEVELLNVDILKAGHHGSKTSTSATLLEAASPSAVVISAGQDNRYGHPHPAVVQRIKDYGAHLWRTDEHGSIAVTSADQGWLMHSN